MGEASGQFGTSVSLFRSTAEEELQLQARAKLLWYLQVLSQLEPVWHQRLKERPVLQPV
jgi:hypothetical protein